MYRAVAWAVMQAEIDWQQAEQIGELSHQIAIRLANDRVEVDGEDVTRAIRDSKVTAAIHHVADNPVVRRRLVELQRREAAASHGNIVTEGRDQGTVAFPEAECKIFLTASAEERARRRMKDLADRGEQLTLAEVLARQNQRDQRDRQREMGALIRAADAVEVDTDGMTPEQVLDCLEQIVRERDEVRNEAGLQRN